MDIRLSYFAVRITSLYLVEIYLIHLAGCFFYFLATTYPEDQEEYTWMGSLTLGNFSFANFTYIDVFTRYVTSIYWATVTMATLGRRVGEGLALAGEAGVLQWADRCTQFVLE